MIIIMVIAQSTTCASLMSIIYDRSHVYSTGHWSPALPVIIGLGGKSLSWANTLPNFSWSQLIDI